MSKLSEAVSKTYVKRLGQDVEPLAPKTIPLEEHRRLRERRKRRARAADDEPVKIGSHLPANVNAGTRAQDVLVEPEAIREARARLRAMIVAATKDAPKTSVGIVLAIVNQETGNHEAANALIDEYELEKLYGIKKFSPNG